MAGTATLSDVLTPTQLAQLAYNNGARGPALVNAVAVAMAESSGHYGPASINNTPATGDYSVGPWQINYYGKLGPERTAAVGPVDTVANDPQANAHAAALISDNWTNFAPWSTYKNGAYRRYLTAAEQAAGAVDPTATGPVAAPTDATLLGSYTGGIPNPIDPGQVAGAAGAALSSASGSIAQLAARAALYLLFVAAGLGLIVLGLVRLTGHPVPLPIPIPV